MLETIWAFLRDEANRAVLAWIGGGVVAVAVAAWTVFVFFWEPSPEPGEPPNASVEADRGGVAIGGDVSGATIQTGATPESE